MKKTLQNLQRVENAILVATFTVMVASIFIQVVNRNIFKIPVSGFEEAAKYCMVYMVMLGTELGLRDGSQIAVTGVIEKFRGIGRNIMMIISKLIVVVFSGIMTNVSWNMVMKQVRVGQTSPGLHIPMWVPYSALLISFALITVIQLAIVVTMVINIKKTDEPAAEKNEISEEVAE